MDFCLVLSGDNRWSPRFHARESVEAHGKATQRWMMGIFDENNLDYYRFGLDILKYWSRFHQQPISK
jgi:hypothetical protein